MPLASLCYDVLRFTGATALARQFSPHDGLILCYHNVVPQDGGSPDELGLHMPLSIFERQMRWLATRFALIPLDEFVSRLERGASLRRVASITFDDGYASVFEHAWPLLRDLRIPATAFILAETPGRDEGFWWDNPDVLQSYSPARRQDWLTRMRGDEVMIVESMARPGTSRQAAGARKAAAWSTIAQAAKSGLQLGVHSATHRSLPMLDDVELDRELVHSRDIIRSRTGAKAEFFAYPYGAWNDRVRQRVRSAGYRAAFTLDYGHKQRDFDAWALPRLSIPAGIKHSAFQAWTAGLVPRRNVS
jgi:peptidoglycan/xylan/chitin deacetylase (PgdA/CDA1 family)